MVHKSHRSTCGYTYTLNTIHLVFCEHEIVASNIRCQVLFYQYEDVDNKQFGQSGRTASIMFSAQD